MTILAVEPKRLRVSEWTPVKQRAFTHGISVYAAIAAAIQANNGWVRRWFYMEPTAGSGELDSDEGVIDGSPLIALKAFRAQPNLEIDCLLIEHDPGRAACLRETVRELRASWNEDEHNRVRCEVHEIDSRDVLSRRSRVGLDCGPMGLVYWDGLGSDVYPTSELSGYLKCNRKHDLLVMASANAPKRAGIGRERLDEMIRSVPRRHVYLSDTNGQWEWTFALATNWEPLAGKLFRRGIHFHSIESPIGREILDKIGTTAGERKRRDRPTLFQPDDTYRNYAEYLRHPRYRAVRAEALARTNGRCAVCGAVATEVHHLRYPPWGTFDAPENLLPVCHPCHCQIEGKDS